MTDAGPDKYPPSIPLTFAEPEVVGMSSARLSRIIPALNAEVEAGQLPGAVVAIARRGRLVFHEAGTTSSVLIPIPTDTVLG
jgi:CubicO group peptidase (beta-lactamase class C family)